MSQPSASRYAEVYTPVALRDRVQCTWQFRQGDLDVHPTQVLPDGCIDLIWNGTSLFVAGPDRAVACREVVVGVLDIGHPGKSPRRWISASSGFQMMDVLFLHPIPSFQGRNPVAAVPVFAVEQALAVFRGNRSQSHGVPASAEMTSRRGH